MKPMNNKLILRSARQLIIFTLVSIAGMMVSHFIPTRLFWYWVIVSLLIGHLVNRKNYQESKKTSTKDINGVTIKLGDIVDYDFDGDDPCPFEVVFEDNAFRKKYPNWDDNLTKPMLEIGNEANRMRLKIIKS